MRVGAEGLQAKIATAPVNFGIQHPGDEPVPAEEYATADIRTALAVTGRLDKWRDHEDGRHG